MVVLQFQLPIGSILAVNIPVEAAAVMAGVEAVTGGTGVGAAVGTGLEGVAGMVYRGVSGVGDILSEYIWSDPTKILPKQTDISETGIVSIYMHN